MTRETAIQVMIDFLGNLEDDWGHFSMKDYNVEDARDIVRSMDVPSLELLFDAYLYGWRFRN